MTTLNYIDLGVLDYKICWDFQEALMQSVITDKLHNKKPTACLYFGQKWKYK